MHLFLSPHLDDVVLSCGGLIHQLARQGEAVTVWTLMAGIPDMNTIPDTPLIRELHQRWQIHEHPVIGRRKEDEAALKSLGNQIYIIHFDWPDCPYRVDSEDHALYPTGATLFGNIHPADPLLKINLPLPDGVRYVYAPLGAGEHVDHKIVNQLARQFGSEVEVLYYEEYPYSASGGEGILWKVSDSTRQLYGSQAIQTALARFGKPLQSVNKQLSSVDLEAKIKAISYYKSQISTFWKDIADMAQRVRAYAEEIAPGGAERIWREQEE